MDLLTCPHCWALNAVDAERCKRCRKTFLIEKATDNDPSHAPNIPHITLVTQKDGEVDVSVDIEIPDSRDRRDYQFHTDALIPFLFTHIVSIFASFFVGYFTVTTFGPLSSAPLSEELSADIVLTFLFLFLIVVAQILFINVFVTTMAAGFGIWFVKESYQRNSWNLNHRVTFFGGIGMLSGSASSVITIWLL